MINYWVITGDTHGDFNRFRKLQSMVPNGEKWGVIILGDCGINYYLNRGAADKRLKYKITHNFPNLEFFCVRGNHEQRPELVPNMRLVLNKDVMGKVYEEEEYPSIHYFVDGATYIINGKSTLILGGAYSVDKEWRLARAKGNKPAYAGWFPLEQLTAEERGIISAKCAGKHFDVVLSHTCPIGWEPREKFLSIVDQSTVDRTMEYWMEELKNNMSFNKWWFGHYHTNKDVNEKAEILYEDIKPF